MTENIEWVYVTRTGKKYYGNPDASMLRGKGAAVPLESALVLGYEKATRGYY